jgi:hypothetical protein
VFVGRTSQEARDAYFPYYADYLSEAPQFANGMLMVGSPQRSSMGFSTTTSCSAPIGAPCLQQPKWQIRVNTRTPAFSSRSRNLKGEERTKGNE